MYVLSLYCSRQYSEANERPLLESSPGSDRSESWSSWGNEWGGGENSPTSPQTEELGDSWGEWGSDVDTKKNSTGVKVKSSEETDEWQNEDWGGFTTSSNSGGSSKSSKKDREKKKDKKDRREKKSKGVKEPATANLIDFSGDGEINGENQGLEEPEGEEVWAKEEDDGWQSLELNTGYTSKKD